MDNQKIPGLPVMSLDNPEVVKLRIAKEKLDTIFALQREQLESVSKTITRLLDEVKTEESKYKTHNCSPNDVSSLTLHAAYKTLMAYAKKMGIFFEEEILSLYDSVSPTVAREKFPLDEETTQRLKHQFGSRSYHFYSGKSMDWSSVAHALQCERKIIIAQIEAEIDIWRNQKIVALAEEIKKFIAQ